MQNISDITVFDLSLLINVYIVEALGLLLSNIDSGVFIRKAYYLLTFDSSNVTIFLYFVILFP